MPQKTSAGKSNGADAEPPFFRIGRSNTGLGMFALAPIRKGKFIIEYWGKKISNAEAERRQNKYLFDLNSRWTIDGADRKNTARYINHSCRPNAVARTVRGAVRIYAQKNIKPGDEITYNYGREYFKSILAPIGCKCVACAEKPKRGARKRTTPRPNGAASKAKTKSRTKERRPSA